MENAKKTETNTPASLFPDAVTIGRKDAHEVSASAISPAQIAIIAAVCIVVLAAAVTVTVVCVRKRKK